MAIFVRSNNYLMGVTQIGEELHRFINHADDRILNLMYGMMKADMQKDEAMLEASIDEGLEQSKKGEVRPHEHIMAEIRARYKS